MLLSLKTKRKLLLLLDSVDFSVFFLHFGRKYYRSVILAVKCKQEGSHCRKSRALSSEGNTALAH